MGRSQVKYNRTHGKKGRGGGRGRGRGRGAETPSSRSHEQPRDNNAWRYEMSNPEADALAATGGMDAELLDLETQRLPQYYSEKLENENNGQDLAKGISLSAMGKALDQLSEAQRLGVPAHLTVDLEVRDTTNSNVVSKGIQDENATVTATRTEETREDKSDEGVEHHPSSNDNNDAEGADEDNLDAWLDSVIT